VTELDLGLKVAARRVLWGMGYTTRVDVPLRSVATDRSGTQKRKQAFTDLDVLGLTIGPGFRVQSAIVDCKTSTRGSAERMFWVRGVADFFAADDVYMVREHGLGHAARQLAGRLGIAAMTSEDLSRLEEYHQVDAPLSDAPLSLLFDREHVAQSISAFGQLDQRLRPLAGYRQFDYWVYDEHRNPLQLVEHLRASSHLLDSRNPVHLGLVFDLGWLYLLTISHAVEYIRTAQLSDPDNALQEYVLGGPLGLREKRELSTLLSELKSTGAVPAGVDVTVLPSYFPALRELAMRVLRRPATVLPALRLLEIATAAAVAGSSAPLSEPLGPVFDEIAAKQAADVIGFLVASADLDRSFRTRARFVLLGEVHDSGGRPRVSAASADIQTLPAQQSLIGAELHDESPA
jgi:hypothetical protein